VDLNKLTLHEIKNLISKKEVKVDEVVAACYGRIENIDDKIGSFLTLNKEDALRSAFDIQKKLDNGEKLGSLAGIPAGIKDNMCTEGLKTTCASKMLENFIPPYDATVVKKLKSQDAIIMGKMNMDEFAMGGSTENSYFKKTRNPWDLERVPGGSSGGSAASVAADEVIFSLGSDTGGSIRQPASFCGVVGLKPTYGAVSRYGLVAFASSLDQIGPLTKDVEDCAIVLNAITGYDKMDSTSANVKYPDYTASLVNDVKGLKIGIPKEFIGEGLNEDVKSAVLAAAKKLESLGAIIEEFSMPMNEYAIPAYYMIACAEASSNLARFDGIKYGYRASNYTDLLDLYKQSRSEGFGDEVKRRIMLGTYALSAGYYDAYYNKALKVRTLIMNEFDNAFAKYDCILGPTAPTTAYKLGEKSENPLEMYLGDIYTVCVNIAGLPGLVVPCGFDSKDLPIGMQLIGKAFGEGTLLRVGYTFEQNSDFSKRKPSI